MFTIVMNVLSDMVNDDDLQTPLLHRIPLIMLECLKLSPITKHDTSANLICQASVTRSFRPDLILMSCLISCQTIFYCTCSVDSGAGINPVALPRGGSLPHV